jgi:SAM-dependent methyltransferase
MKHSAETHIDVARLMQRVEAEVASRGSDHFAASDSASDRHALTSDIRTPVTAVDVQRPPAVELTLPIYESQTDWPALKQPANGEYELQDILCYQDRDFIYAAYLAVLSRVPDAGGLDTYLRLLRAGTSKIDVLRFLSDSAEGRALGRRIKGLAKRVLIARIGRWPLIGSIARALDAVAGREEEHRQQRALHGHAFMLLDQAKNTMQSSQATTNRALRQLETAHRELVEYAAAKPTHRSLAHLEASLQLQDKSVRALQSLIGQKADGNETRQLFDRVHRTLSGRLDETRLDLDSITAIKADAESVKDLQRLMMAQLDTKADRACVEEAIRSDRETTLRVIADLQKSKADCSTLHESHHALVRALDTKAARHELTDLTNHIVHLLESRITREELVSLEQTLRELHQTLADAKADRTSLDALNSESRAALENLRLDTTARLVASLRPLEAAYETLAKSKVDQRKLDELIAGEKESVQAAVDALSQSIIALVDSKVDRTEHNTQNRELLETLRTLVHSKIDRSVFETALSEARVTADSALLALNQAICKLEHAMVDRDALDAKTRELHGILEALRMETSETIYEALRPLQTSLTALAQSRVDGPALESALGRTRATMEVEFNLFGQSVKALVDAKADRDDVDAIRENLLVAFADARADVGRHVDTSLRTVREAVDSLANSKSDRRTLDAVKEDSKAALEEALSRMDSQTRDIKRNLLDQERRIGLLLEEARKRLPKPISTKQIKTMLQEEDHLLDSMYASFEDTFRGTREDIKQRQTIYLPNITEANAGSASTPVVDIGCGRGEWLEVLRDAGLTGRGVDINRVMLAGCRDLNLNVIEMDGVAFLKSLPAKSIGAVTSFHLVEHLDQKTMIALFDAVHRALRPGGVAIFETPNPRNVQVGSCTFYLDPTHRRPIPPELLKYLLEARGFVDIQIKELHPSEPGNHVTSGSPMVNDTLNRFFFSAQDYAVISKKA